MLLFTINQSIMRHHDVWICLMRHFAVRQLWTCFGGCTLGVELMLSIVKRMGAPEGSNVVVSAVPTSGAVYVLSCDALILTRCRA